MKILLVSPFTSASGSAIRFWNIAQQFRERGWDVIYIDRLERGNRPLYQTDGISYRPSRSIKPLVLDIIYSAVYNIVMLFRNLDAAVFYALKPAPNNCCAAVIAKLLGKKVLLDIDDLDYEYLAPGLKRGVSRFFFRLFPKFFPLVTCHTPNLLAYCKNDLRLPDKRLYYLAQGVSREFLRISVSEKPAPPQKSILYVATLGITSDFDDLLPALARVCAVHRDAKISVIGDGVRRPSFEASAAKLGLSEQIAFLGRVPHAELPDIMARHNIGLNYMRPSFVNNCRAILKIREYLACRLQVVCNNAGDAELFSKFAFVEPDIDRMEKRLLDLLEKGAPINHAGRTFIEESFSWKSIMSEFIGSYGNIFRGVST